MAYTSIIPVHRLDNSISYIQDKEKTAKKPEHAGTLEEAIDYALDREKTEQMIFVDSIGCTCEDAYQDMLSTKRRFHKLDGVQGYHLIQSFASDEVSPELAHLIGQELTEQLLKGQFEAVLTTHLNTSHYHNHLVFNSVSMADGRKYHSNTRSYYEEIQRISDGLCRKYGLSVIQTTDWKGMHYAEWRAEQDGKPTWRTGIRLDIRDAIQCSFTWKQFVSQMEKKGYEWKLNRKYISLRAPGMERYVRLKSLGKNYSENVIRSRILCTEKRNLPPQSKGKQIPGRQWGKPNSLQALYYSYLYQMGVLRQKPTRAPFLIRTDIRHLEQRIAQMEFLQKNGITSREQLADYRKPLEESLTELIRERHRLYRSKPHSERIAAITEELKPIRKELRMCLRIAENSRQIEQKLKKAEEWEREKQSVNEKQGISGKRGNSERGHEMHRENEHEKESGHENQTREER